MTLGVRSTGGMVQRVGTGVEGVVMSGDRARTNGASSVMRGDARPSARRVSAGCTEPREGRPRPARRHEERLVGLRADRLVLVAPREVRFAEADGNDVWLTTDRGRLRARERGLGRLADGLAGRGFLRVHRRFIVNLDRVREIEPAFKGALWLVMDAGPRREVVPVSRRRSAELRRALGI